MTLQQYASKLGFDEASEQTHVCGEKFGISLHVRLGAATREMVVFGHRAAHTQARNDLFQWLRDVHAHLTKRGRGNAASTLVVGRVRTDAHAAPAR